MQILERKGGKFDFDTNQACEDERTRLGYIPLGVMRVKVYGTGITGRKGRSPWSALSLERGRNDSFWGEASAG